MRKRLLPVLLVLVMVLSMVPVSIFAETVHTPGTHTASHKCEKCGASATWQPWTGGTSLPTSGHYYLTGNVTLSTRVVASDLCLCLNGYTITGPSNERTLAVAASKKFIAISDCTAVQIGDTYYAGKITGGTNTTTNGGTIYVGSNECKLYFYDGIIENCRTYASGGGIFVASGNSSKFGTVTMDGGEIRDNVAMNGSNAGLLGGGIYVGKYGKCYIRGGKITGNDAKRGGGIYGDENATVVVKNATVSGNHASELAGGVYMHTGTLSLQEEVIITGNTAVDANTASNLHLNSASIKAAANSLKGNAKIGVTLAAARISAGDMTVTTAAAGTDVKYFESDNKAYEPKQEGNQVVLTEYVAPPEPAHEHNGCNDAACTDHGQVTYEKWISTTSLPTSGNYYLVDNVTISAQTVLTGDLNLCLNGKTITGFDGNRIIASNGGHTLTIGDCSAKTEDGVYTAGKLTGAIHSASSNNSGGAIFVGTNDTFYLFDGILTENQAYGGGGAVRVAGTMYMYNGQITKNSAMGSGDGKEGGGINVSSTGKLYLYGGTIAENEARVGGGVYCLGGVLEIADTKILNNTATKTAGGVFLADSVAVTLSGNTQITGNTVDQKASNLVLPDQVTLNVGQLSQEAKVSVTASVSRYISGDAADYSALFSSDASALSVIFKDGKLFMDISDAHKHCLCNADLTGCDHSQVKWAPWESTTTLPASGNYYLTGDVTVSAQTVLTGNLNLCLNGKTITGFDGNRIIASNGGHTLTIGDCSAKTEDGVYTAGKLTGAIHSASSNNSGGAIFVGTNDTFYLFDGILTENQAYGGGGAVRVAGTMYMYNGQITKNSAMGSGDGKEGGGIYVSSTGKLYLYGGTIAENEARVGGGIYCLGGVLEIADTKILNNTATKTAGGVFLADSVAVTLSGNTQITGNTVDQKASNLVLPDQVILNVGQLSQEAKVSVTASAFRYISGDAADYSALFSSDASALDVIYKDGKLFMDASSGHKHCLCNADLTGCDHSQVKWAPWESTTTLPTSGNYYLTGDVTVSGQTALDGTNLNLCLNGYTIKTTKGRVYYTKGNTELTIADCKGTGVITGADNSAIMTENKETSKPVISVYGGTFKENSSHALGGAILGQGVATVNIYGGTFEQNTSVGKLKVDEEGNPVLDKNGNQQADNAIGGAAIGMYTETSVLNIYGGTFKDNTTTHVVCKNADGSESNKGGYGVIYSKGVVNVKGGTFEGGNALLGGAFFVTGEKAVLTIDGGTIQNNEAKGGAVVAQSGAVVNMNAGQVTGNTAGAAGGAAFYISGAQLNVTGGTISGNTTTRNGGAVYVDNGVVTVTGGTISDNKAIDPNGKNGLGAAFYSSKTGSIHLMGGTVTGNEARVGGGVYSLGEVVELAGVKLEKNKATAVGGGVFVANGTELKVSGNTRVMGNTAAGKVSNLILPDKDVLNVGAMGPEAKVSVTAGAFSVISGNVADYSAMFQCDDATMSVVYKDGKLQLDAADGHQHCLCKSAAEGCDHSEVKWAAWESKDSLPTFGNYYLTGDVTVSGQTALDGTNLNLCLNGYTIKTTKGRVYYTRGDAHLNITDCTGNGVITGANNSAIMTENKETSKPVVNVFGGTFKENSTSTLGGAIVAQGGATLNIYGGTFENNISKGKLKVDEKGEPVLDKNGNQQADNAIGGAAIGTYGTGTTLNIYGGTFKDNTAIHVEAKTASGGVSNKGGYGIIYIQGQANVYGGSFTGGEALLGGAFFVSGEKAVLNIEKATISNNYAKGGGAIVLQTGATVNLKDATISGNESGAAGGGAIYISTAATLNMTGGKLTGNVSAGSGGAVYVTVGTGATIGGTANLLGGEISGNTAASNGAGVFVNRATAVLNGTVVKNNEAKNNGGGVYGAGATLIQIDKSEISGNKAKNGAGIYATQNQIAEDTLVYSTVIVNDGAVISGNKAETNCGGLMLVGKESVLDLNGGTITGNEAKNGGGVLAQTGATVNMKNAKITGNKASVGGGGMYIAANTTLNMQGGTIFGNDATNSGGGLLVQRGYAKFTGGTISKNTATTAGAVHFAGAKADIHDVSITNNTSRKNGGAMLIGANTYTKDGVKQTATPVVNMYGGTISSNSAPSANAGAILMQSKGSVFNLHGGIISNNTCIVGGGAVYVATNTTMNMNGGTISGNEAKQGGAIFCQKGTLTITGGKIYDNKATASAGAVYVIGNSATTSDKFYDESARVGIVTVKNVEIYGNQAAQGGAFEAGTYGTLNMENVKVHDNTAEGIGGGVYYNKVCFGNLKNVLIYDNVCKAGGGGLAINVGSIVTAENITVENNRAEGIGGGIYNRGRLELNDSVVRGNITTGNGGGIGTFKTSAIPLSTDAGLYVQNTLVTGNRAVKGAGLYLHVGCVSQLTDVTVEKNISESEGSGIYANGQNTLTNVTVTGNTSETDLYALYFDASLYDGHTYYTGKKVLQGNIIVKDNQGGDGYLGEGAAIAIPGAGLGEDTYLPLDLHSGLLTQQVIGCYNYDGGNLSYIITAGDRSITDPEVPVVEAEKAAQTASGAVTSHVDIGLVVAVVIAVAALAVAVILILKKKKKTPVAGKE